MEIYRRKVGYEDYGKTTNLVVTATTLYFPFFLKQNFEDIGLYTDTKNPIEDVNDSFNGNWNQITNTGGGTGTVSGTVNVGGGTPVGNVLGRLPQQIVAPESNTFNTTPVDTNGVTFGTDGQVTSQGRFSNPNNSTTNSLRLGANSNTYLNNCNVTFYSTPITSFGANDGSLSIVIDGCPGPQTVEWTGPDNFTATGLVAGRNNLTAGNYIAKIYDFNNNITFKSYILEQPQSLYLGLTITTSQSNVTYNGGNNGSASIIVDGGLPPYTYLWYSGTPSNVLGTNSNLNNLIAGRYSVRVQDSNGTIVSSILRITEPLILSGFVVTTTNVNCNGNNNASIVVRATDGVHPFGYIFELTGPVSKIISGTTSDIVTFDNLTVGTYTIKIYDNNTNVTLPNVSITQPEVVVTNAVVTSPTVLGYYSVGANGTGGTININPYGGNPPYFITISKDGFIFGTTSINPYVLQGLGAGTYEISSVDSVNCLGTTDTLVLKQRPILTVSADTINTVNGYNIACNGGTTGVTYNTYYVTGTTTHPIPTPTISYYMDNILDATITGLTTQHTFTGLTAGDHNVLITDGFATFNRTFTLTQPPEILLSFGEIVNPVVVCSACTTSCKQSIVQINGGVSPYTIQWSGDGDTSTSITSNPHCTDTPVTISVTVTDSNGCSKTQSVTLS